MALWSSSPSFSHCYAIEILPWNHFHAFLGSNHVTKYSIKNRRFETSEIKVVLSNSFCAAPVLFHQNFLPMPMFLFMMIIFMVTFITIIMFIFISIPMLYPTLPLNSFLTRLCWFRRQTINTTHDLIMKLPHLNSFWDILQYWTGVISLNF